MYKAPMNEEKQREWARRRENCQPECKGSEEGEREGEDGNKDTCEEEGCEMRE